MDFYKINSVSNGRRDETITVYPIFKYDSTNDLVCKGGEFYAFWYDNTWNTDIRDLITIVDKDILETSKKVEEEHPDATIKPKLMKNHNSNVMKEFSQFTKLFPQVDIQFNTKILFSNHNIVRSDYSTNKLPYTPTEGPTDAFDEMFMHLYDDIELEKILWFIGALLTNNMENIQKFMYIYGSKGSGKGTVIKLMEMLFEGYYGYISLARLTSGSEFATSQVKELPLLIDSDSKIEKIRDDTNLLKLTSHEALSVNIKHKQLYDVVFKGLLVTASNQRYQVNNVDSGITRRAVVVHPSERRHSSVDYFRLMERIPFELPQIANKAISVFNEKGPFYYEDYVDVDMAVSTDHIFSFVRENYNILGDPCSLKKASELYRLYLEDIGFDTSGYKRKIKEELKRYYSEFKERQRIGDEVISNVYTGFKYNLVFPDKLNLKKEKEKTETIEELERKLGLGINDSPFDSICADYPAQYTNDRGTPLYKWENVKTTLAEIDTSRLHYVRLPLNHVVIDFDIKDENGNKDLKKNLEKALMFPKTYTEISKSGLGVHLHYIYEGDVSILESMYDDDIEVKVFTGKSALRRRLTKCNTSDFSKISTGLPKKEREKIKVYDVGIILWNEKKMIKVIENAIAKNYKVKHTKPMVDLIASVFEEAEAQGVKYDLRHMYQELIIFASRSSNQKDYCIETINGLKLSTVDDIMQEKIQKKGKKKKYNIEDLHFFDGEVYPNYLLVVYKKYGNNPFVVLENPTSEQIEAAIGLPLVGFNNRRYDNHILYSRLLNMSNLEIYRQSQRIINKEKFPYHSGAYELSYADIYEYSSKKQSLKKWEVELGIDHKEMEIPWDSPIEESMKSKIIEYCKNDVAATEAVFNATYEDYAARLIISDLSGLSVNSKTQDHAKAFIFGDDPDPSSNLVYTDLSKMFKGYKYDHGKSTYKGLSVNEGGRVISKPGIYKNVGLFDVVSMHPYSMIALNYFGKYTDRFKELVEARVAVKKKDFEKASKMLGGVLEEYLNEDSYKELAHALKIIINIIYGMTSASWENPFKHPDNVDNIVAKRGALFMVDLQEAIEEKGYNVIHVKTDSVKVENVDDEIAEFIFEFGKKYGYEFDWEDTFETIALVDDANYVTKNGNTYDSTGAIFSDPVVMKTLFTNKPLSVEDFRVVKEVKGGHIYLGDKFIGSIAELYASISGEEALKKSEKNIVYVNNTKGYLWKEFSECKDKKDINMSYYHSEVEKAYKKLAKVGDPKLITNYESFK